MMDGLVAVSVTLPPVLKLSGKSSSLGRFDGGSLIAARTEGDSFVLASDNRT